MGVVAEAISVKSFQTYQELGDEYVIVIEKEAQKYNQTRVIFNDCNHPNSLEECHMLQRRERCSENLCCSRHYNDDMTFLAGDTTKDPPQNT